MHLYMICVSLDCWILYEFNLYCDTAETRSYRKKHCAQRRMTFHYRFTIQYAVYNYLFIAIIV